MSKIAENKALEAYPEIEGSETYFNRDYICTKPIDLNKQRRQGYIKGYDKALKDFLEKAEKWLEIHMPFGEVSHESVYDCIQEFKNYMQDESEN